MLTFVSAEALLDADGHSSVECPPIDTRLLKETWFGCNFAYCMSVFTKKVKENAGKSVLFFLSSHAADLSSNTLLNSLNLCSEDRETAKTSAPVLMCPWRVLQNRKWKMQWKDKGSWLLCSPCVLLSFEMQSISRSARGRAHPGYLGRTAAWTPRPRLRVLFSRWFDSLNWCSSYNFLSFSPTISPSGSEGGCWSLSQRAPLN